MERYEIETFLSLAEELNFTRTAERLLVSPGRVSQTIKKLERRLGGALFERSSRHVALTPVGQQLYTELLPAYQQIRCAVDNASAAFAGVSGVLRAGFTTPWSGALFLRASEVFNSRHRRCTVELREVTYNAVIAALQGEDVDLAVTMLPFEDPAIVVGPVVFREPRALLVPAVHPLAARETVSLEDLAVLPLITAEGLPRLWQDAHFPRRTPQGRPIEHGTAAAGWQGILSLVGAGQGASVATARTALYHGRPDIVYVPFEDAPPIEYALMWRHAGETVRLREFVQTLLELAPQPTDHHHDQDSPSE